MIFTLFLLFFNNHVTLFFLKGHFFLLTWQWQACTVLIVNATIGFSENRFLVKDKVHTCTV